MKKIKCLNGDKLNDDSFTNGGNVIGYVCTL